MNASRESALATRRATARRKRRSRSGAAALAFLLFPQPALALWSDAQLDALGSLPSWRAAGKALAWVPVAVLVHDHAFSLATVSGRCVGRQQLAVGHC